MWLDDVLVLVFLALCAYYDIRTMSVPRWLILAFAMIFLGLCLGELIITESGSALPEYLPRLLPGIFLLVLAFTTKQAMGYGDGLVILLIGLRLPIDESVLFILIALIFSAIASLSILAAKRGDRRTRLPFVPFLLAAWMIIVSGGGNISLGGLFGGLLGGLLGGLS